MPYVYEEGWTPVPAGRCTHCGTELGESAEAATGPVTGWFEPSTLDEGTWVFTSGPEAPAERVSGWLCPACGRRFRVHPERGAMKHP